MSFLALFAIGLINGAESADQVTHEVVPVIQSNTGLFAIRRYDVAWTAYATVSNVGKQNLFVVGRALECCEMVGFDEEDCSSMKMIGGSIGILRPGQWKNVTFLFPNLYLYNRRGQCTVEIWYKDPGNATGSIKATIPFDTYVRPGRVPNHMTEFLGLDQLMRGCESPDLDPLDECRPVDCHKKYNGNKNYYHRGKRLCVCNPTCYADPYKELPDVAYIPTCNECRDLELPLQEQDVKSLLRISLPNTPKGMQGGETCVLGIKEYENVKCHHGWFNNETMMCECEPGWTSAPVPEDLYLPSTLFVHFCTVRTPPAAIINLESVLSLFHADLTTLDIAIIVLIALGIAVILLACTIPAASRMEKKYREGGGKGGEESREETEGSEAGERASTHVGFTFSPSGYESFFKQAAGSPHKPPGQDRSRMGVHKESNLRLLPSDKAMREKLAPTSMKQKAKIPLKTKPIKKSKTNKINEVSKNLISYIKRKKDQVAHRHLKFFLFSCLRMIPIDKKKSYAKISTKTQEKTHHQPSTKILIEKLQKTKLTSNGRAATDKEDAIEKSVCFPIGSFKELNYKGSKCSLGLISDDSQESEKSRENIGGTNHCWPKPEDSGYKLLQVKPVGKEELLSGGDGANNIFYLTEYQNVQDIGRDKSTHNKEQQYLNTFNMNGGPSRVIKQGTYNESGDEPESSLGYNSGHFPLSLGHPDLAFNGGSKKQKTTADHNINTGKYPTITSSSSHFDFQTQISAALSISVNQSEIRSETEISDSDLPDSDFGKEKAKSLFQTTIMKQFFDQTVQSLKQHIGSQDRGDLGNVDVSIPQGYSDNMLKQSFTPYGQLQRKDLFLEDKEQPIPENDPNAKPAKSMIPVLNPSQKAGVGPLKSPTLDVEPSKTEPPGGTKTTGKKKVGKEVKERKKKKKKKKDRKEVINKKVLAARKMATIDTYKFMKYTIDKTVKIKAEDIINSFSKRPKYELWSKLFETNGVHVESNKLKKQYRIIRSLEHLIVKVTNFVNGEKNWEFERELTNRRQKESEDCLIVFGRTRSEMKRYSALVANFLQLRDVFGTRGNIGQLLAEQGVPFDPQAFPARGLLRLRGGGGVQARRLISALLHHDKASCFTHSLLVLADPSTLDALEQFAASIARIKYHKDLRILRQESADTDLYDVVLKNFIYLPQNVRKSSVTTEIPHLKILWRSVLYQEDDVVDCYSFAKALNFIATIYQMKMFKHAKQGASDLSKLQNIFTHFLSVQVDPKRIKVTFKIIEILLKNISTMKRREMVVKLVNQQVKNINNSLELKKKHPLMSNVGSQFKRDLDNAITRYYETLNDFDYC